MRLWQPTLHRQRVLPTLRTPLLPSDSGSMATVDSGARAMADASVACPQRRCEGNTLIECNDGVETRIDCESQGRFCSSQLVSCEEPVCEAETTRCDGIDVVRCNETGDAAERVSCEFGCDANTGACRPDPLATSCEEASVLSEQTLLRVDLCFEENHQFGAQDDCHTSGPTPTAGDHVATFTLSERRRVRIRVSATDGDDVDTVVYLRSSCTDPDSQIALRRRCPL